MRVAKRVMAAMGGVLCILVAMLVHYGWIALQVHELRQLRAKNQALTQKTREYEDNVGRLQTRVASLQKVVDKLGMMAGVEVAAVGNPGARGHELQKKLYDRGLHLKSTGDTLIVAPAFIAEKSHIDDITNRIRDAIAN